MSRQRLKDTLSRNVKALRLSLHLTQESLAKRAGLSSQFVSLLERGQRNPTLDVLESLSKALSVTPSELLATDGESISRGKAVAIAIEILKKSVSKD